jgi:hypothetical protein
MSKEKKGVKAKADRRRRRPPIPPRSGQAGAGAYQFLSSDDLAATASEIGASVVADDLQRLADNLNSAFNDFILWAAVEDRDSGKAGKADWCDAVANDARTLLVRMGWAMQPAQDGQPFRDAMNHLGHGFPLTPADRHDLDRLILAGAPATWREGRESGQEETDRLMEGWWKLVEQMRPALVALALTAERAEAVWSAKIANGGSEQNRQLLQLFRRLGLGFSALTGSRAKYSYRLTGAIEAGERERVPEGPAMDWHLAILGRVAGSARKPHGKDNPHVPAETCPGAAQLATLADHYSQHRDGLAKMIRKAARKISLSDGTRTN